MDVTDRIRETGCALFAIDPHSLRSLEGNGSAIYVGRRDDRAYVIKFLPMQAEHSRAFEEKLHFLQYLAENEANVAHPLPSGAGNLMEIVEDDGRRYAVLLTAFTSGVKPNAFRTPNEWNESFFKAWGKAAGRLHDLARRYPVWQKPDAAQPELLRFDEAPPPATEIDDWREEHQRIARLGKDAQVLKAWHALEVRLARLPQTRGTYGLTHNDLRHHNILFSPREEPGKEITIFDFGTCAYNWYLNDIASSLYHAMMETMDLRPESLLAFSKRFLPAFMQGYNQEYELDRYWWQLFPLFLQRNQVLGYIILADRWLSKKTMPWQTKYLARIKRLITGQVPLLPEIEIAALQ